MLFQSHITYINISYFFFSLAHWIPFFIGWKKVELLRTPAARLGVDLIVAKTADVSGGLEVENLLTKKSKKKSPQPSLHPWWIFLLPQFNCHFRGFFSSQFNWGFFSQASPSPKNLSTCFAALRSLLMVERVGQGGLVEAGGLPSHPIHRCSQSGAIRCGMAGMAGMEFPHGSSLPGWECYRHGVFFSDPAFF